MYIIKNTLQQKAKMKIKFRMKIKIWILFLGILLSTILNWNEEIFKHFQFMFKYAENQSKSSRLKKRLNIECNPCNGCFFFNIHI